MPTPEQPDFEPVIREIADYIFGKPDSTTRLAMFECALKALCEKDANDSLTSSEL